MAILKIETEVSKEVYEVGQGLVDIIKAAKLALADGWQPGSDIPVVISSTVGNLGKMIEGIDKLDDEFREDLGSFAMALGVSMVDALALFVKSE